MSIRRHNQIQTYEMTMQRLRKAACRVDIKMLHPTAPTAVLLPFAILELLLICLLELRHLRNQHTNIIAILRKQERPEVFRQKSFVEAAAQAIAAPARQQQAAPCAEF